MISVQSVIHPITGLIYQVGDNVCVYQGRFGHNNIINIKSIWLSDIGNNLNVIISEYETLPGTYLSSIKHKVSDNELNELNNAKLLVNKYK